MRHEENAAASVEAFQSLVLRLLGLVFLLFVAFGLLKEHFIQENWPYPAASALVIVGLVLFLALVLFRSGQPRRPSRFH